MTPDMEGKLAIVAEDDPANRLVLCRMLSAMNCTVLRAINGDQAIKIATREAAAIVFMDLNMPGKDGYEAVRAIRAMPDLAHLRVIAVTGDLTARARAACIEAGFDGVLSKPVRRDALAAEFSQIH